MTALPGAVPYLRAFARVLGSHYHLKSAMADAAREPLARFAIRRLLPEHAALLAQVREGAAGLYALTPEVLRTVTEPLASALRFPFPNPPDGSDAIEVAPGILLAAPAPADGAGPRELLCAGG